jgi:hypothetical protein
VCFLDKKVRLYDVICERSIVQVPATYTAVSSSSSGQLTASRRDMDLPNFGGRDCAGALDTDKNWHALTREVSSREAED